jgi:predicted DNA binding CopG/RHH family protein
VKKKRKNLEKKTPKPKSSITHDQSPKAISPEEALQFLEDIRTLQFNIDEPTVSISLRVPRNILRSLKLKAKADGKKYQSLIIEYLRFGLKNHR